MSPHAGVAVRLQLHANRQLVPRARVRGLLLPNLRFDTGEGLDVVADFMREDVRLGEVAGRAEAIVQLVEEAQIEVDRRSPGQ